MNRDTSAVQHRHVIEVAVWQGHADGIVYDAELLRKPATILPATVLPVSPDLFDPAFWQQRGAARAQSGGRGSVLFIHEPQRDWVLRHYRRGGLVGKVFDDQYLWLGAEATRCFREWRLLAQLRGQGLPVPAPVAARYQRSGWVYRADLLTAAIPQARTLAQWLGESPLAMEHWHAMGHTLARFHATGVQHADLNAHNILLDATHGVHVLDFDRGRRRAIHRAWIDSVLQRLLRSLYKLKRQRCIHFGMQDWTALRAAHDTALKDYLR